MTKSILRAVFIGILVGISAFFIPKILLGIFIFCAIISIMHCGCMKHGCGGRRRERFLFMADKIRKMSDEEFSEFKTKMDGGCCNSNYHHKHCCCKSESKHDCNSKTEETTK